MSFEHALLRAEIESIRSRILMMELDCGITSLDARTVENDLHSLEFNVVQQMGIRAFHQDVAEDLLRKIQALTRMFHRRMRAQEYYRFVTVYEQMARLRAQALELPEIPSRIFNYLTLEMRKARAVVRGLLLRNSIKRRGNVIARNGFFFSFKENKKNTP